MNVSAHIDVYAKDSNGIDAGSVTMDITNDLDTDSGVIVTFTGCETIWHVDADELMRAVAAVKQAHA